MTYNNEVQPIENLEKLKNKLSVYNIINNENKDILYSLSNEFYNNYLYDQLVEFSNKFQTHLVEISTDERGLYVYSAYLLECEDYLNTFINENDNFKYKKYFNQFFQNSNLNFDDIGKIIKSYAYNINKHYYHMIGIIKSETVEFDKLRIIRNESSYQWVKDKSELAEIIFKILKTKSVESKNSQEVDELKFSRELAAFFGIHKLNPYKHYYSKKP